MSTTVVQFPEASSRCRGNRAPRMRCAIFSLAALAKRLRAARERRHALLEADDRMLADLGISRAQARFLATERVTSVD